MLLPTVVQTEADKVFVNILNNQTVSLSNGDLVVWNTSTPDGVRTTQPATATLSLFVGVADGTIAASAYGLAQAYGYKSAVLNLPVTNVTVVAGDILVPVNGQDYGTYHADSTNKKGLSGFLFAGEGVASQTTPAAATIKAFIRAL